ncbi:MAG: OmpA family protein, partial [Candidatus Eisenbacteria bacterium]|nr:OmpA family protein [Candidatus Eisenbacteria bacterium]
DINDECPDTPAGTIVDAVGCPKPVPVPVPVPVPEPKPELVAVMVNFALDSADLDDMAMTRLDALVTFLLDDTTITVDVGGHASSEGAEAYNQALSERRAVAVRDYLAEKGIEAGRVTVVGYGVQQPLVPNDSETNRSQNRRAIVTPVYPE